MMEALLNITSDAELRLHELIGVDEMEHVDKTVAMRILFSKDTMSN